MKVRFRTEALADIEGIRRYLAPRSPNGARNVLRAIRQAVRFIADNPMASAETDEPGIHMKVVSEYPYKIFYSEPIA